MSSRALCGGARASRSRPRLRLSSRSSLSSCLLGIDLATAVLPPISISRYTPRRSSNAASNEAKLHPAKEWGRVHVTASACLRSKLTLATTSNATAWAGIGSRRSFSRTTRHFQGQDDTKSKDRVPAPRPAPSAPAEPRGLRKVIPKVLPTLTPHENIYTVPNILTFSRLIAAPFVGYAILHDAHGWALGLFAYAGVSDLLDGWIARRWKLQTVVGSVVDPMADKMLMTVLTVCLAYQGALPVWLAAIILGRDVGLGIAAIYYRWISLPPPKTFTRYWDFSLPSAEVRPTTISKYNTFLQLGLMGATMVTPFVSVDVGLVMTAFQYLVASTTIWSGLSYVFSKDAVRILSEGKDKPKDP
ncbi:CDP-alcohol phosphatidyltransferase-domain-containing protein [Hypoxylon sp. NC1633]|nr:CDP-alcohol phosphatidyltransferase-domain-containing protein [Hypoxylon sp. NC1633]